MFLYCTCHLTKFFQNLILEVTYYSIFWPDPHGYFQFFINMLLIMWKWLYLCVNMFRMTPALRGWSSCLPDVRKSVSPIALVHWNRLLLKEILQYVPKLNIYTFQDSTVLLPAICLVKILASLCKVKCTNFFIEVSSVINDRIQREVCL